MPEISIGLKNDYSCFCLCISTLVSCFDLWTRGWTLWVHALSIHYIDHGDDVGDDGQTSIAGDAKTNTNEFLCSCQVERMLSKWIVYGIAWMMTLYWLLFLTLHRASPHIFHPHTLPIIYFLCPFYPKRYSTNSSHPCLGFKSPHQPKSVSRDHQLFLLVVCWWQKNGWQIVDVGLIQWVLIKRLRGASVMPHCWMRPRFSYCISDQILLPPICSQTRPV